MSIKQVSQMPTEGQFVAVWIYDGAIWSDTLKYVDGVLHCFSDELNDFAEQPLVGIDWYRNVNADFYVLGE